MCIRHWLVQVHFSIFSENNSRRACECVCVCALALLLCYGVEIGSLPVNATEQTDNENIFLRQIYCSENRDDTLWLQCREQHLYFSWKSFCYLMHFISVSRTFSWFEILSAMAKFRRIDFAFEFFGFTA